MTWRRAIRKRMIWNNKSESEATRGLSLSTEKEYELCTDCGVLWLDRRRVRTPKSPIPEKRWRKIYAGFEVRGKRVRPGAIEMPFMDTSTPCSISWRGGRQKIVPLAGHAEHCTC